MFSDLLVAVAAVLALSAVVVIVWDTVALVVRRHRLLRQKQESLRAHFRAALLHLDDARRLRNERRA